MVDIHQFARPGPFEPLPQTQDHGHESGQVQVPLICSEDLLSTGLIRSGRLTSVSFHCERDSCTWWLLSTFIVAISWVGTFPTPWMLNGSWFVSNRLFLDMELLRSSTPTKEASLQVMSILGT